MGEHINNKQPFIAEHTKQGYAGITNRAIKCAKIVSVLSDYMCSDITNFTILDIGTGSGGIANGLAQLGNHVTSVDVKNMITETPDFRFVQVDSVKLPFENEKFDIVVSNHVIEHLGSPLYWEVHIGEINRVLRHGGYVYFATPNRQFPWESHTRVFFAHWLPKKIFFAVLKMLGRYQEPICLLTHRKKRQLFKKYGFDYREYTIDLLRDPAKYHLDEWTHGSTAKPMNIPDFIAPLSLHSIFALHKPLKSEITK